MSGKRNNVLNAIVDIIFEEDLTSISCSKMVIEIIKYLAYQKQQIPYPFEQLKLLVNKGKVDKARSGSAVSKSALYVRYHTKAVEAVETLESIFQNIEAEFMISYQGFSSVEEVVILFGATPVTPKDVFRIQIPDIRSSFDFETPKPPSRKMMVHLLKCLLESESLHSIVSQPITTTNTYVFFKRKLSSHRSLEHFVNKGWFLPRENFKLPEKGRQAVLRIKHAPKEIIKLEAESPLARPLVSDIEITPIKCDLPRDGSQLPLKNVDNLRQQGYCISEKVIKIPGFELPNHLVFKAPTSSQEGSEHSITESCTNKNSNGEVQCLIGNASGHVNRLSEDFGKLSFSSCMESIRTSNSNSIEWFEARVPIRGFKDCVVNGISAISS